MSRPHAQLLIVLALILPAVYFLPITSNSQSATHSLSLNGTSSYMSVPNSATINISGPITIEAWIKLSAVNGNYQDIVCREAWGQSGTGGGYEFAITNTGKVRLDLYQGPSQYTTAIGSTTVTTNVWHHVAGVFDGNQMRVYLDGVLDGSLSTTSGPASGTSALNIGKSTYTTYYFGGLIDDVRISAAALYTSNFTAGLGPASNTRALWKFDGQTTNDSSGNGNHGTLQSSATYSTDVPTASNTPPTIALNDPQPNTAFNAGATIVMDAAASDVDGVISKVDFYQGATLLGTDTSSPYTLTWPNVSGGVYSLTAKATDDGGAIATSNAITVNVLDSASLHSLSLNGTSSYVSVPNSATINISGPITIEAWIKLSAVNGNYQDIVCREAWGQSGTGGGYEFAITNTGKVRLDLYQGPSQYTTAIGSTTVTTNVWHHVAGVFDGNQMRVYLDGMLDGSLSTTSGPASGTSALNIGKSTYTTYYFGGLIDEVRISAAALYTSNFTAGLGPASNTRALWKFDGQTSNDFSGNANHGALQGGATYSTNVPSTGGAQRPVAVAGGPYSGQTAQAINFSSTGSFDPDGTISNFHWNFGDGTSANTANPSHTYQTAGSFTATLTATDNSGLRSSATAVVTVGVQTEARLDVRNQIGGSNENPLSQNFNWSLPLLNLPGRAGMDLGLTLSYNSLVWTKNSSANYISFDDDRGFPSPGFRLGFPVIQQLYFNATVGKYAFLLIGADGGRTELRQVGASALYEAADSSHLLLDAVTMTLRTSDGTQLSYALMGNEYNCTQIKDTNGNYITVSYNAAGRIDTVVDTLSRTVKFNYDANGLLASITQAWASQVIHNWAVFTYTDTLMQTNFSGLSVLGPANNSTIKTLSRVTLADNSHYDLSYTSWGQVWKVSNFAPDNHLLNQRAYNLPGSPLLATGPQDDCPRFTQRRDWAQYWNGDTDGTPVSSEDAVTSFAGPVSDTWTMPDGTSQTGRRVEVTSPDGTVDKIYFIGTAGNSSAWRRGLPALVVTYSGGVWQRKVSTNWTQDDPDAIFVLNPRVTETNVYDPAGNRARTRIEYEHYSANGTSCDLPRDVFEYATDGTTILRTTRTLYNMDLTYTSRHILGLISDKLLHEGDINNNGPLMSKLAYSYDESGSILGADAPVQHDNTNYTSAFVVGRGNLTSIKRFDVTNTNLFTTSSRKYNTAGATVSSTDPANHTVTIGYADAFADGVLRNTLAYPTLVTDGDGYSATSKYNFDFGAVTRRQMPQPNTISNLPGPEQSWEFDAIGRLLKSKNLVNNAYTRFEYSDSQIRIDTYATIQEGLGEAHSFQITDGAGRVIATATDHNLNTFSAQKMVYNVMGRVIKTSNPAETTASGSPSQWTTTGDDVSAGWIYTEQSYDWKSRPLVTTNPSLTGNPSETTTKQISYSGCGCAGGQVVTVMDEGTIADGVAKRRQQKIYSDILGRTIKIETLNWQDGTVYSTTVNSYNVRDQLTQVRRYVGAEGSGSFQDTTFTYDGYARLKTRHQPEQQVDPTNSYSSDHTTWNYNPDDTVQAVTDARGASQSFAYNGRHLVTGITYAVPSGITTIAPVQPVAYSYDAARNRTAMLDGNGRTDYSYDQLSRMLSETRQFNGVTGSYALNYDYNLAGELKAITDPTGATINYGFDALGRVANVSGSAYGGVTQYASAFAYRAWGALKGLTYGNNLTLALSYNARLKATQFEVAGRPAQYGSASVMKTQYQYYDDGALKYADDLLDNRFDRAYGYDQLTRLKEDYSGSEASDFVNQTSSGTTTGPYRQSYSYDGWSNFTSRSGRFWSKPTTFTASYSNGRNTNSLWQYDADGRVLRESMLKYTFDAAGRNVTTANILVNQFVGGEVSQTRDGDGLEIKREETRQGTTTTGYRLRSSVLGGQVVTELNATGQKQKSYVYLGAERLAEQEGGSVVWKHTNPLTGSEGSSYASGLYIPQKELDPTLVDVGFQDPYLNFEEPQPDSLRLLGGNSNGQCTIEGMSWDCMSANRLTELGVAEEVVPTTVYAIYGDGRMKPVWSGLARPDPLGRTVSSSSTGAPGSTGSTGSNGHAPDTGSVVLAGTDDSSVTVTAGADYVSTGPQNFALFVGQTSRRSTTTDECKTHRALLLGRHGAALEDAWNRSQFGTSSAHEEGGLLGSTIDYGQSYQKDSRVNANFTPSGAGPRAALTGFKNWAFSQLRADKDTVTYDYWYHTHPFEQGDRDPVTNDEIGDPNRASYSDTRVSVDLRLRGVLVTNSSIIVYDFSGNTICEFARRRK